MKTHRVTLPAPIHAAALRGDVSMVLVRMEPQPTVDDPLHYQADMADYGPYAPGDLIACRELHGHYKNCWLYKDGAHRYDAPVSRHPCIDDSWFPASRMPLLAVRLWFRVQAVEACRVADVTEEEARAMGYEPCGPIDSPDEYWSIGEWAWKLKVERTERNGRPQN